MKQKWRIFKKSGYWAILSVVLAVAMMASAVAVDADEQTEDQWTYGLSLPSLELGQSGAGTEGAESGEAAPDGDLGSLAAPAGGPAVAPMALPIITTYGYSASASNAAEFKTALDNSFNLSGGLPARIELTNDIQMDSAYSLNGKSGIVHIVSDGTSRTVFSNGGNRHFRLSNSSAAVDLVFYLDDIILDGNNTGGGFNLHNYSGSSLTIIGNSKNDAIIQNCHEDDGQGGFISSQGVDLILEDLTIRGCSSSSGGAIHALDEVDAIITNVDFIGNSTTKGTVNVGRGGAIYTQRDSTLTIDNCSFTDNWAEANAGAVYLGCVGPNSITNTVFTGNRSGNDGGAVSCSLQAAALLMQNCSITQNEAVRGGAFYLSAVPENTTCDIIMDNVTISDNRAITYGGAIHGNKSNINLTIQNGSSVTGNTAKYGGGVSMVGGSKMKVEGSAIDNNTGSAWGGGLYVNQASLRMTGGSLSGNSTDGNGGGAYFTENLSNTAVINNTVIQNNTAGNSGGGAYVAFAGNAEADRQFSLTGVSFGGNVALTTPLLEVLSPTNMLIEAAIFNECSGMANGKFALNNFDVAYMGGLEQFTLTYHANGGDGTPPQDNSSYFSGQSAFVLDGEGLTKDTREFLGWAEFPGDRGVTQFENGDYYQVLKHGSNALYAVYAPLGQAVYNVTFDANGGEFESGIDVIRHRVINNAVAKPDTPSLGGYYMTGWYTDMTATSQWDFATPVTNHMTLYAGWVPLAVDEYEVAFHARGGSYVESQIVKRNGTVDQSKTNTTRENHILVGWADEDGDIWDFSTPVTDSMHLYALWEDIDTGDGGSGGGGGSVSPPTNNNSKGGSSIPDKLDRTVPDTETTIDYEAVDIATNQDTGEVASGNINDVPNTGFGDGKVGVMLLILGAAAVLAICCLRRFAIAER